MSWMFDHVGHLIARLQKPANHGEPFTQNDSKALSDTLRRGDVLLVEGKSHISGGIKYLTQSTWSHSALYIGPMASAATEGEPHVLIEANIDEGVVSAPLSKYLHCQTRICRPVGLSQADCQWPACRPRGHRQRSQRGMAGRHGDDRASHKLRRGRRNPCRRTRELSVYLALWSPGILLFCFRVGHQGTSNDF
jgi:Permuted papain-like amidase enzyme, YaeF/YiiX, C92 family